MKMTHVLPFLFLGVSALVGCSADSQDPPAADSAKEAQEKKIQGNKNSQDTKETADPSPAESEKKENDKKTETPAPNTAFEGISFLLPAHASPIDLGEQDHNYPISAYYLDPSTGANFNVLRGKLSKPVSLDKYVKLATDSTGFEYLSNKNYTENGIQWNEAVSLNHTENGTVQLNQRTFMLGDSAYIFTYASAPNLYEGQLSVFRKITGSVVPNKSKTNWANIYKPYFYGFFFAFL